MFLHEDRQVFEEVISATSEYLGRSIDIVEKDYYPRKLTISSLWRP